MSHTEDLVEQASEVSIKALENSYQESQKLSSNQTWVRSIAIFVNTHIFHKIGLHVTRLEKMDELIAQMGNWSCSGSFESFLHRPEEWDRVYEMLSDDYSKATFDWFVKYRTAITLTSLVIAKKLYSFEPLQKTIGHSAIKKHILGNNFPIANIKTRGMDYQCLRESLDYNQYDYQSFVSALVNDTVIDAGAYRGDTVLFFSSKIGREGIIYAFEPDNKNYEYLEKNIQLNHLINVKAIKAGLGYRSSLAKQQGTGGGINLQVANNFNEKVGSIKVYSIDDFIAENKLSKIDFIKMDIEGWELDALKGAENCLKSCKPKLAVCVYHKPEDLLNIVNYLKQIVPGYQLYLDHKSTSWNETILYATV